MVGKITRRHMLKNGGKNGDNLKLTKISIIILKFSIMMDIHCDPVGILTQDLQNRNLTFYTAELRSL